MKILELSLRRFRGFEDLTFQPNSHVALIGEPRAGRSDLIEGLRRVLTSDGTRHTVPSELDFWMLELGQRAEVEVVLGDLGPVLERDFVEHLEAWDQELEALAEPKRHRCVDRSAGADYRLGVGVRSDHSGELIQSGRDT